METVDVLLVAGAAARLTRLTTRDEITKPLRDRLLTVVLFTPAQRRAKAAGTPLPPPASQRAARVRAEVADGLSCNWCVGVWWSALVALAAARWRAHPAFQVPAVALTAAYVLGWVLEHERSVAQSAEGGP